MINIKVAIMGAGLSGLSCAITLEKNGINPDIYEKRGEVGDRFVNGEIFMPILTRPVNDVISYFAKKFDIYLKPTANIKKLIIYSENRQASIDEQVGFINIRGRYKDALEKQLATQIDSKIFFNSQKNYTDLLNDYTHIIIATGDPAHTEEVQDYQKSLSVTLKGATVTGKFNPFTVRAWLNNNLVPRGYGYFIPFSGKEAQIVIGMPEKPINNSPALNQLWNKFFDDVCRKFQQNLKITDQFQIRNYVVGICSYPRIGNTYFTGNCFGSLMPFLGFGQFGALLTGVYAAQDISGSGDYEKLTKPLKKSFANSLILRKSIQKLNNNHLDKFVTLLNGYPGKLLFTKTRINYLRLISYILRPLFLAKLFKS